MKPGILFITDHLPFPAHRNGSSIINGNLLPYFSVHFDIYYCCLNDEMATEKYREQTLEFVKELHVVEPSNNTKLRSTLLKLTKLLSFQVHENIAVESTELDSIIKHLGNNSNVNLIFSDLHFHAHKFESLTKKKIVSPHDSRVLLYQSFAKNTKSPLKWMYFNIHSWVLKKYERFYFNHFDKVLFVSSKDAEYASAYIDQKKIHVINNGMDISKLHKPKNKKDNLSLVFSGKLDYKPNRDAVEYLVKDLLPRLHLHKTDIQLSIVGACPDQHWQKELEQKSVTFKGHVTDLYKELSQHDIYLCPLSSGAGFKNKVLDAISSGIPVLGTPLSFDGMIFKAHEDYIEAELEDFEKEILSLDQDKNYKMANQAQDKLVRHYQWSNIAKQYIALIKDTLET